MKIVESGYFGGLFWVCVDVRSETCSAYFTLWFHSAYEVIEFIGRAE